MAAWNSSSLAFSDHNNYRDDHSDLMKNMPERISKQHFVEQKLFGSKRKNIQLGKTFKKKGKGILKKLSPPHMARLGKGVSPSLEEFDNMMKHIVGKSGKSKKMFKGKFFG